MILVEFTVSGRPATLYSESVPRRKWMRRVNEKAMTVWGDRSPTSEQVMVTILYFSDNTIRGLGRLDADNYVKPILDAMIHSQNKPGVEKPHQHPGIYEDDSQVQDVISRIRSIFGNYRVSLESTVLVEGLVSGLEFVYVRVETAPDPEDIVL